MGDDTETTTQTNQTSTKTPGGQQRERCKASSDRCAGSTPDRIVWRMLALRGLLGNYDYMSQFAPQISGLANSLLGGGTDRTGMVQGGMDDYRNQLAGTIEGQFLDPSSNPFFNQVTSHIGDECRTASTRCMRGAGRDPSESGGYGQNLGRGIAEGVAPVFAQQYQQERQNQLGAMNSLYGAGNQSAGLLSQLDQTALGKPQHGRGGGRAGAKRRKRSVQPDPCRRGAASRHPAANSCRADGHRAPDRVRIQDREHDRHRDIDDGHALVSAGDRRGDRRRWALWRNQKVIRHGNPS